MIVDDSATMRKIIKRVLRQAEIEFEDIVEATNGVEALEQLSSNPDVALILSDMNMPEMNGVELVKKVREQKDATSLPIIMVTTEGADSRTENAMGYGANGYVTKPFTADCIRDVLSEFI
ncbi:UNVERIFIED_CONTAM: hypothetical protein GTU68_036970 [Idotea baltica]|nr:hypothetical protein [Idotea baltica]